MFEHIQGFLAEETPGSNITLSYAQMSELGSMVCNAMILVGNSSALLSKQRRAAVLNKINTKGTLISLTSEEFPDAGKNLFGEGLESRIKMRSETAKTLLQASLVGQRAKPFSWAHHPIQKPWEPLGWCQPKLPISDLPLQQHQPVSWHLQRPRERNQGLPSSPPNISQPIERLTNSAPGMDLNLTLLQVDHLPLAGRIKHCLINWEKITTDSWCWRLFGAFF